MDALRETWAAIARAVRESPHTTEVMGAEVAHVATLLDSKDDATQRQGLAAARVLCHPKCLGDCAIPAMPWARWQALLEAMAAGVEARLGSRTAGERET